MAKAKSHRVNKKKKIHPLLTIFVGFFGVVLLAVLVVGHAYKNVSPLQEVAGTQDSRPASNSALVKVTPSTQSCMIMMAVRGTQPCGKDSYKAVSVICGDGSQPQISTNGQCQSLVSISTKLAQACVGHSSCKPKPSITPNPSLRPSGTPRPTPVSR